MGGVIALLTCLRHPSRVRRLALSVTAGGVDVSALGATNWRDGYRAANPQVADWVYEPWPDLTQRIGEVRQPTLLIWGDADPISPVAVGRRLADLLPDAELRVLPGGDHGLIEERAAEVTPWVLEHLG
jgi:pimeloyl-ACP methyl ester carboxylesterase